jgi:hypothetical protein
MTVWQRKVQEHRIDVPAAQPLHARRQPPHRLQLERISLRLGQRLLDQPRVARIVLASKIL